MARPQQEQPRKPVADESSLMAAARLTDGLVGCVFGFPARSDGFWWLGFDGALPRSIEQLTDSSSVFANPAWLLRGGQGLCAGSAGSGAGPPEGATTG
ncbi:hypothetical protein [Streptomyces spectabilis]|uniref:Uncharacterized protein n=1 Tax=Streptomyces spectabilis TaxID=68270 RepID=A0A516R1B4_STRST|nr:hypothetical protein [Streptomyces spectabilis]QDQ09420.1 hypothetical protein FH965_01605 [Streptomyces spectabilis]